MAKYTRKSEEHPLARGPFSKALLGNGRHANVNFALSSNNKDQLIDLNNYLRRFDTIAVRIALRTFS